MTLKVSLVSYLLNLIRLKITLVIHYANSNFETIYWCLLVKLQAPPNKYNFN